MKQHCQKTSARYNGRIRPVEGTLREGIMTCPATRLSVLLAALLLGLALTLAALPARAAQDGAEAAAAPAPEATLEAPKPAATVAPDRSKALLALLDRMKSSYASLKDFTATFQKQEKVGNKMFRDDHIELKFQKPFKVYMKWMGEAKEALYVEGEYNNKVLARCDGLLGLATWSFSPRSSALMRESRHPITEVGFGFILDVMNKNIPKAHENGDMEIVKMADDQFDGRPATVVEAKFKSNEGRQYYTSRIVFHVDKEFLLPVGIACYDDKGELQEEYIYKNLKPNSGLTEMDFSKDNKQYRF
ncbi:DUF1571 domain-containing protein [Fundidesulfovibrio soli]|uniref:DUF1571 domain-containing protein n=1 Tax=Fundidesulfovibrio soli TaxID=2922716 RepID=UPI001FAE9277|nr:DUF1571 domain-containing protein [Fundidesulfovibrio soli]